MEAVYKLLTLNKNAANSVFERLRELKGLKCVVKPPRGDDQPFRQHEPGEYGSIFGYEDKVAHDEMDSYGTTLLIFNLFREGYMGENDFDSFNTEAYCLTRKDEVLPIGTEIEVDFYGRKMHLKVDDHRNLTPTVTEQLFIKNILVPAT